MSPAAAERALALIAGLGDAAHVRLDTGGPDGPGLGAATVIAECVARTGAAERRAGEMEARYDRLTLTVARQQARIAQLERGAGTDGGPPPLAATAVAELPGGGWAIEFPEGVVLRNGESLVITRNVEARAATRQL